MVSRSKCTSGGYHTFATGIATVNLLPGEYETKSVAQAISSIGIIAIYNIYFHPLRKYPGPLISSLFHFPQFLVRLGGRDPQCNLKLHEKYGDIVRVGPDALSFAHPDIWRDVYAKAYGEKGFPRHHRMYANWKNEKSVFNANGPTHSRQRKVFSSAFSERAVREYEPTLHKHVGQLIERMHEAAESNEEADASLLYTATTLDIMADLAARKPTKLLEEGKSHKGWALEVENKLYHLMMSLRTYPFLSWIFVRIVILPIYLFVAADQKFDAKAVRTRQNDSAERRVDIWKYAQKDENGHIAMGEFELKMNVDLLMFAGSETTANLLTGVTYFLLHMPDAMKKLVAEIQDAFKSSEEMAIGDLARLDRLNACLKEGLRMHPPAPSNMLRQVPPEGGIVCGKALPGGTEISAAPYAMDHLSKYWKDPWTFAPERWLGDERYKDDVRDALQPFSVGSQNCLGLNLAWHEARLILASVFFNFELELVDKDFDWKNQRGLVVWDKSSLMVRLRKRSKAQ